MVRLATRRADAPQDQTCVWMDAGLLAYRLCDRGFDCEHCPLDAALRGKPRHETPASEPTIVVAHPTDRQYTTGHTWVRDAGDGARVVRLGIDAFGGILLGDPRRVRWPLIPGPIASGEAICAIELEGGGSVPIGAPASGEVIRRNEALTPHPELIRHDSYGAGWLVEILLDAPADLADLLPGTEAARQARLDLRRFRRHVGLELLTGADVLDPGAPIDGSCVTDLRRCLSPEQHEAIVRDLVH